MGDPSVSAETCGLPWYQAFSALCAGVGSLAGAIAAAALTGGGLTAAALAAAGVGAVVGALLAYCACRMSAARLPKIQPAGDPATGETSVPGMLIDIGRSFPIFPFGDGDYLFNIACVDRNILTTNASCVRTKSLAGPEYLHCEITSNVTLYGCAGAIAGAAAAAPVGIGVGTGFGAAVAAGCLAAGIFAPLCILAALLVALIVSGLITGAGALAGGAAGSGLGLAADEIENQVGEAGADTLHEGDTVVFTGDWVTDADHGWNEVHDIKRAMVIDRGLKECVKVQRTVGAVAVGLMPRPQVTG